MSRVRALPKRGGDAMTAARRRAAVLQRRSRGWREMSLTRRIGRRAVRRARIELVILVPLLLVLLVIYGHRREIFGGAWDDAVRGAMTLAVVLIGWELARDIGRAMEPTLFQRMDPGTAGTIGFVVRLATVVLVTVVGLRIAGLTPRTLALGGALTAVVVGLAAQQTLGNLFAGTVLLSARPFRVGDRVRMQGGGLAGTVEGVVSSLGLLYTTLASGDNAVMVPNSIVISVAVVPLREPAGIDLRARLRPGVTPADVEDLLSGAIQTPIRGAPRVTLEEVDGDEVVVHVAATPERPSDGPRLATEVLRAIASLTQRDVA
jgi:small conductance mechanosensitive channel